MKEQNFLPTKVRDALDRVEEYFTGVIPWLANMYDPKTNGFYMAMSGRQDPEMVPAIEMTSWAISILKLYTDAMKDAPQAFVQGAIQFFHDRQDPESGLFQDTQGPVNAREQARNQDAALRALRTLDADTKYIHPSAQKSSDSNSVVTMPEYMNTTESYLQWLETLPWDTNSWTAGDQTQSSQQYIKMLPEDRAREYQDAVIKWLENRQFASGLWAPEVNFNSVSGAFKVGLIYNAWGLKLPDHETIVDTVFRCYKAERTSSPYFVRNPISLLLQISRYSEEMRERIRAAIIENIDAVTASFGEFLCPDGAFSAEKGKSMMVFGGVKGSHGKFEGDIDATLMMLIARMELYTIFGASAPKLNTDDFWAWISGEK